MKETDILWTGEAAEKMKEYGKLKDLSINYIPGYTFINGSYLGVGQPVECEITIEDDEV